MNPIAFAMRRPLTILVAVVAVGLGSVLAVARMPIDIFPNLNLPIIYVAQPYGGMDPAQMEGLLTNYYEYHFLYIGGIHHVESRNVQGMALMKLSFHPGTDMAQAMAETIGYVNRSRAFMPPGTVSPFITRSDAGSVPVGYLVLASETRTIGEIQDQALFKVRPMFAGLPGVSAPPPFGGSQRTVVVRVDPDRLRSLAMSPDEVVNALAAGNAISPSGAVRIGEMMPMVPVNSIARQVKDLESIPIRVGQDPGVILRDVATVADASDIPTGYALVNGRRAVYILVTKRADASTVSVVANVREALPRMQAVLPDDIRVSFEFDQSPTVTRAMASLATEGASGAVLSGLMVLVFLRDWRAAVVVVLNIPIALAAALVALGLLGQSINLMTLGGLALAVGILVDESTVEVENIRHQMESTPSVALAVRRGNAETAVPRLLAMLCVLAVFLPSTLMRGAARALFVPLALAVGSAMVASYLLSSTFVPVLSAWLLRPDRGGPNRRSAFDRARDGYGRMVGAIVRWRWAVAPASMVASALVAWGVGSGLGLEIFPQVDAGRFQLRLKAPTGTRIEATEKLALAALEAIGEEVGRDRVEITVGYVGLIPSSYPINAIYQWTGGPEEALLRVALKPGAGPPIEGLKARLRDRLKARMPEVRTSFEPADVVGEVMSFGSPTPVEVAVTGPSMPDNRAFAEKLRGELARVDSLRDLQYVQALDYPTVDVEIDRERAGLGGLSVAEVSRSLVAATSSSRFVVPIFWPDPKTGIGYQVQVEVPFAQMDSIARIETIPVGRPGAEPMLLRDVATVRAGSMAGEYDRYNMKRTVSLSANIVGEDLGRVSARVDRAILAAGEPPRGVTVDVRGQIAPMKEILRGLAVGLALAVVVILLLLTANFQSIRLALVAVSTTPAVVAGVAVALRLSGTTINLQSFMGAIMAVGVALANAILLVSFAEQHRRADRSEAPEAAALGAVGRLRPILMTSFAMVAGMAPMALGWGEGGEQAASLGLAVIGGLVAATLATLFALPAVFAIVQAGANRRSASLDPFDPDSSRYIPGSVPLGRVGPGLLALVVALFVGCDRPIVATTGPPSRAAVKVEVVRPGRGAIRRVVEAPGQVEAFETTAVHAKVAGYVRSWGVNIGSKVSKGQVMAELDVPEAEAEADRRRAMLEQAQARRSQAEAAVEVGRADVDLADAGLSEAVAGTRRAEADLARWRSESARVEQLFRERAQTGTLVDETRSKLQGAEASRDEVEARVKSARAAVAQAKAALEKARVDVAATASGIAVARTEVRVAEALLAYNRIVAPFDGVVTRRNLDTGHLTVPGGQGDPLFVVARLDLVTVAVAVPELFAAAVEPGDRATIRLQAIPGRTFEGTVTRTAHALDPRSRTLRAEVDLPNPDGRLLPGLYAYASIVAEEHAGALTLPTSAIARDGDRASCVVVRAGRAEKRPIGLGWVDGVSTEVLSGLQGEESVVKAGAAALVEGQAVEVASPPRP